MIKKYKTLVVKMNDDATNNAITNINYELLCDVEIVMGLTCVLPMLEVVHNLNKLVQNNYIFILILFQLWSCVNSKFTPRIWILKKIFLKSISSICGFGDIQK
jgi:hypothetical protein